jgi:hypothetical protein
VALHSHAFIFLSLLLLTGAALVRDTWGEGRAWLATSMDWASYAMAWWLPAYLFIAQKRIYGQGWIATAFKFSVVGVAYTVLLAVGLALAVVFGLFNL